MVRVRYAPSPTGTLHIGGARTALFNFLFARHWGGRFILRVEDTDRARLIPGSEAEMMSGLKRLGIVWDEGPDVGGDFGPYRQSERADRYRHWVNRLLAEGKAYRCFCTPEELEAERQKRRAAGLPPRYNGKCRDLSAAAVNAMGDRPYVLRLKVPAQGTTVVDDLIRGPVQFDNGVLDDFVVTKADGSPVYNFAVVIDDYEMQISHVIRGEEHLSNTPKQILVAEALGLALPQYAHVPMILAPDRSKLSKRHGATSVEEYLSQGILGAALVNYLVLLGWSPPEEREILNLEEAASHFDLNRVQHTAAIYDQKKLEWMNGQYLRTLAIPDLIEAAQPFLADIETRQGPPLADAVALVRERARTLVELAEQLRFCYQRPDRFDPKGVAKLFDRPGAGDRLLKLADALSGLDAFDHDAVAAAFDRVAEQEGVKRAEIIHPARLALTGRTVGPGLFELVVVLGPNETALRLREVARSISEGRVPTSAD